MVRGPLRGAARDRIIADPCIDIKLPKLKDISKTFGEVLTADEVDRLTVAMLEVTDKYSSLRTNHRYQALVFMGACLGLGGTKRSACGSATSIRCVARRRSGVW